MTPEQRTLRSRAAAHVLHSRYDSRELTASARKAFLDRFDLEVDPNSELSPAERARRAAQARKAYFTSLAFKSAKARQRKTSHKGASR